MFIEGGEMHLPVLRKKNRHRPDLPIFAIHSYPPLMASSLAILCASLTDLNRQCSPFI